MASQTSDTPNGLFTLPPTAGLPADPATAPEGHPCGAIPSQGCQRPCCLRLTPRPASRHLLRVTASPLGWLLRGHFLYSPQCLQRDKGKPGWGPPTNHTAGVSGKEPSYLSSKFGFPSRRSPLGRAGSPCAGAMMYCISTDCTCWLCRPTPGGCVHVAP